MKLENMKDEFPQTPDFIRDMIKQEVEKLVREDKKNIAIFQKGGLYKMKRRNIGKVAAIALVATMAIGTTVYAASRFYKMYASNEGEYAIKTKIEKLDETKVMEEFSIPKIKMETTYLPDNMVDKGGEKFGYKDTPYEGGISIVLYRMDMGDDAFEVLDKNVLSSQEIQVNGHDGVYLELAKTNDGSVSFDKRIYVSYPEVHHVMQMYVGSNVSKEEALKMGEGVILTAAEETETENTVNALNWSDFVSAKSEKNEFNSGEISGMWLKATSDDMKNTHVVGDTFSLDNSQSDKKGLMAKVTKVEILDNINVLNEKYVDIQLTKETDENGNLISAEINYIKKGDGITSVDRVVDTRKVPQKLVYVTAEYTNTSNQTLEDILYFGSIIKIETREDEVSIYQGEKATEGDEWDTMVNAGYSAYGNEMIYSDILGGSENKNYISSLKAGETVTLHMAFVVTEEDLPFLYLNLDSFGGCYEFSETGFETGYVDIRR